MKVSVLMPTYNHELFIAEAIESFLNQICSFEIELLIGDDASTDGTLKIAQKYVNKFPEKIKLIDHKINNGLLRNYKSIINISQGEYFAILESDDYWIDNYKLQKQIDFLDQNPTYGLSFTNWKRLRNAELTDRVDETAMLSKYSDSLYERFLLRNIIKSPTACFRRSMFEKYCNIDDYIQFEFKTLDFPVWLSLIRNTDLHYLNSATAVYRSQSTSISNSSDVKNRLAFEENIIKIRKYIISLYGSGNLTDIQIANRETFVKARHAFRLKKPLNAVSIFINGITANLLKFIFKNFSNNRHKFK